MAHLRTYTQPTQLFAACAPLAAHTARSADWVSCQPLGALLYVFRGVVLDLTCGGDVSQNPFFDVGIPRHFKSDSEGLRRNREIWSIAPWYEK